ncbi:apoptotic chromatin condensation inducer in the nucleus-like, partial [Scleropages formosus]
MKHSQLACSSADLPRTLLSPLSPRVRPASCAVALSSSNPPPLTCLLLTRPRLGAEACCIPWMFAHFIGAKTRGWPVEDVPSALLCNDLPVTWAGEGAAAPGLALESEGERKMAELEDVTLDGKPLHSLRVADLKAALEQRGLPKSGQKNALIKRLKGALMLENLQRTSTPHIGLQPNSQMGEEMSQNSFIKQYLAKQQELLRQRLEREAREAAEADDTDSAVAPEEEDHTEGNNIASCPVEEQPSLSSRTMFGQPEDDDGDETMTQDVDRAKEDMETAIPSAPLSHRRALIQHASERQTEAPSAFSSLAPEPGPQEAPEVPRGRAHRSSSSRLSHEEPSTLEAATGAAPPRAVASLSVRVVGDHAKEGSAQSGSASPHSTPQLGRSARGSGFGQDESEEEDDSDEDEDWGVGAARRGAGRGQPHSNLQSLRERSRRKQLPPQHIPPPQLPHQAPLQLRQPTPPPSPPPELSFPLPDTPKQSPPGLDEPEGAAAAAAAGSAERVGSPPSLQRQESSSSSGSSGSSSPEPSHQRGPGPLTLLALKMESEGAFARGRERSRSEDDEQKTGAPDAGESASPALESPGEGRQERTAPPVIHAGSVDSQSPSPADIPTVHGRKSEATMMFAAKDLTTSTILCTSFSREDSASATFVTAPVEDQKEEKEPGKPQEDTAKLSEVGEPKLSGGKGEEEVQISSVAAGKERESCLPPWKRGRELGAPVSGPSSPAQGEKEEPLVSRVPGRQSEAPESQAPTALSPQPPSKKFRLLRDMPASSPPASPPSVSSAVVKHTGVSPEAPPAGLQARLISPPPDEGHRSSRSLDAESGGVPIDPLALVSDKTAVSGGQVTEPAASHVEGGMAEAHSEGKVPSGKPGSQLGSEKGLSDTAGQAHVRTSKPVEGEKPGQQLAAEAPVGPVLPPSPPSEEGDVEREKERSSSSSSNSSSSDSDSESSSSRSSESSSSSRDKSRSAAGSRNLGGKKRDGKIASQQDTPGSPRRKRRAEQQLQEAEEAEGASQSKKPCPGQDGTDQDKTLEMKAVGIKRDSSA